MPDAVSSHPHWPVRFDHCFARILLDCVHDRPWREIVPPPAWKNTDVGKLRQATLLGEAVLEGRANLIDLNQRSLKLRGKTVR